MSGLLAARHEEAGVRAADRLELWIAGRVPMAHPEILVRLLEERHRDLLFDSFWQVLPFGTGGRRGRVGYGSNRLNRTTVAMTVQGHCDYLRSVRPGEELAVVVANDVRCFHDLAGTYSFLGCEHPLLGMSSRSLAKLACEIYAGNGIVAFLEDPLDDAAVLSTPELSFAIRELDAAGGINISASHNPPDDNGIKVYDRFGSQPIAPDDQVLVDWMERATDVHTLRFAEALRRGLVRALPEDLHARYLDTYVRLYGDGPAADPAATIVFTPLCGCGLTTAGDLLARLGFPVATPPGEGPDGSFAAIPLRMPNPEVPQATGPARAFAEQVGSGIVLSSDPDADRVGLEVRAGDGTWVHMDGNRIAALLAYYLMLDPAGPRRRGLVVETLVTTRLLAAIARAAGDSPVVDDLLVGFKYIADVLKRLDAEGVYGHLRAAANDLVLAAEESHGVELVASIRDKDAAPACLYLAALYQRERAGGRTLADYYARILEQLGRYETLNRSIVMLGAEGIARKDRIMASLRCDPPARLAGRAVERVLDYWDTARFGPFVSETDRLPRNVVQMTAGNLVVTIRPSGTEPKLKFYCELLPGDGDGAAIEDVAAAIYNDLLARIGEELGPAGLALPDVIDLEAKRAFADRLAPRLCDELAARSHDRLEGLLGWLASEAAPLLPGADPLPALKGALRQLCSQWRTQLAGGTLVEELEAWANR